MANPAALALSLIIGVVACFFSQKLWWRIHRKRGYFNQLPDRTSGETLYSGDYIAKWLPTFVLMILAAGLLFLAFMKPH